MSGVELIVGRVAGAVPEELRSDFPDRRDICVLASRVGYDVLRYFGVNAKPVVARALAFNAKWDEWVDTTRGDLNDPRWEEAIKDGAHSLVVDEVDRQVKGRFAGHLILWLPDLGQLMDLSAEQFSRPDHDMVFPPAVRLLAPEFLGGEAHVFDSPDGGAIAYRYRQGVTSFRRGGDWNIKTAYAGRIIRRLRDTR